MDCIIAPDQNTLLAINAKIDLACGYPNPTVKTVTYGEVLPHPTLPLTYILPIKVIFNTKISSNLDPKTTLTPAETAQIQSVDLTLQAQAQTPVIEK